MDVMRPMTVDFGGHEALNSHYDGYAFNIEEDSKAAYHHELPSWNATISFGQHDLTPVPRSLSDELAQDQVSALNSSFSSDGESGYVTGDVLPLRPRQVMRMLHIDDSDGVRDFLTSRLKRMQQLVDKKIAKAWIKGICPKKQAKFPYQNKARKQDGSILQDVPGWWPLDVCRFIEPDHIKRDERMRLCLHLLTLRPTPDQLKKWNKGSTEPHPTHVTRGWTAFLEELAGPSIFEDLPKENEERTSHRKNLMRQMYEVAALEESFRANVGIPSTHASTYTWLEDEDDKKPVTGKRSRAASVDPSEDELDSFDSALKVRTPPAKRQRKDSASTEDGHLPLRSVAMDRRPTLPCTTMSYHSSFPSSNGQSFDMGPSNTSSRALALPSALSCRRHSEPCTTEHIGVRTERDPRPLVQDPAMWRRQEQMAAAATAAAAAAAADCAAVQLSYPSPPSIDQDLPPHQFFTAYNVHNVPEPRIYDMPNSINISPSSLLSLPETPYTTLSEYFIPQGYTVVPAGQHFDASSQHNSMVSAPYDYVHRDMPLLPPPCAYKDSIADGDSWFNRSFTGYSSGVGGGEPT